MSSEWSTYRLQEVGRLVTGKTPKSGVPAFDGDEVPFVSPPDFSGNKWISKTVRSISEAGAQSVKGSLIPPRSVLVTCIGSDMGKAAIANSRCVTNQQINAILVDESRFCPEFVYYNLSLRKDEIRSLAGGSAQPILNKSAFGQICLEAPRLEVQREVSAALRPLDDRITLLRETNATLEAIAQALFKSWFVDFDPVRAKMEGRAPEGMDEATAALFPDAFEETELGVVPRGWRVGTLADLMRLHKGSANPGLQPDTEFQHFSLPAFDNGQLPVMELGSAIKSNKTTVPADGVLLSKLNPHIPRIWLPSQVLENAVCSTEFLPFVPTKLTTTSFVYCLLVAPNFSLALCQLVTGTSNSHQRIKPDGVLSMPNILPPTILIAAFDVVADALLNRVKANRREAQTISTLRDTLLPRLISGQLRLGIEADEGVEQYA